MEMLSERKLRAVRLLHWSLLACVFVWTGGSLSAQQSGLVTLRALKDQARPLLIFARKPDDPQLEIQVRTIEEHAAEAQERGLAVIALPFQSPSPSALQLTPAEAESARRRFGVAPGEFTVILIGKDGGVKLRSSKPISMNKLEETIDAMPMRQEEMTGKGQPNR